MDNKRNSSFDYGKDINLIKILLEDTLKQH